MILDIRDKWLLSGKAANGLSSAFDTRNAANYAHVFYSASGNSAIWDLHASHDGTNWITALSVTATAGALGMLQISAFYPYVRANARSVYSAAGGSAVLAVHYQPGWK